MSENELNEARNKFPSNSFTSKEQKKTELPGEKKLEKVVTGAVSTKKRSLSKKFSETFLGENLDNVAKYVLYDVLIPAAKNTLSDVVKSGIELLLFGEARGAKDKFYRDKGNSYISYGSYGKSNNLQRREPSLQNRSRHNFDDLVVSSRGEAEEVLHHMALLIEKYGIASVADLYDLVGMTSNFTDTKHGWTSIGDSYVSLARSGGYLINLPRTVVLD